MNCTSGFDRWWGSDEEGTLKYKKMKRKGVIMLLLAASFCVTSVVAEVPNKPLWRGDGRIAISSDGNEHDWDDWAASAMNLAVLASQGLQDKLTLYTYSDHVWGSNQEHGDEKGMCAYNHVRESVLQGAENFGFTNSRFVCAVDNAEVAYNAMRDEINRSTAKSPLYIIAAGPMQVVGEAMNRANRKALKYVTVISHSGWNNLHSDKPQANFAWDIHSGWTFQEMIDEFGDGKGGATFIKIVDQNHGFGKYVALQAPRENFDWLIDSKSKGKRGSTNGSWEWLYSRLESCAVKDDSYFDISDTGMVVYLLTGNQYVTPQQIQHMMENPK